MILRHPRLFALAVVVLSLSAILLSAAIDWYDDSAVPTIITINDIQIQRATDGDYLLEVSSTGPASHDCVRVTQHVIYQDKAGSVRRYVPLASALSGVGYGSVPQFVAILRVPSDLTGDWTYVNRSVYICVVWGLVRMHESASSPYIISLRPSATVRPR